LKGSDNLTISEVLTGKTKRKKNHSKENKRKGQSKEKKEK
jgi:hypothetical protein